MPRPHSCRHVSGSPAACLFVPSGLPACELEEVVITLDQFEALRLADLEGLYQEQAAEQMGVSRPTFGRILESAHRTVADALAHGKALRIEGGVVCEDVCPPTAVSCPAGKKPGCPRCRRRRGEGPEALEGA